MTRINTNVASMRGLRSLQKATNLLDSSLTRLSTGLKINSGKDNPSGLIASETLRLQVTSIEQSIKNSNRANNVIATADSALGEISGLLNQIRGLVQEGMNSGALSQAEIEANQLEIDNALSAINRIGANTTFAGDKLIDGSKGFNTALSAADTAKFSDYQINEAVFGSSSTIAVSAKVTDAATKGQLNYTGGMLTSATTLEIAGSKGSQVLFLGGSSELDNIRDAINAMKDVTGVEAAISGTATAASLSHKSTDTNNALTFTDARAGSYTSEFASDVEVVVVAPGADNGSTTSVSVAGSVVTVTLGHDGTGVVGTADDVIAAIAADADASALVTATLDTSTDATNDGSGVVAALAQTALAGAENATLELTSTNFGSKNFVNVNVLSGSFATEDVDANATYRDAGSDIVATINGQLAQGDGLKASIKSALLDASLTFSNAGNAADTTGTVTITGGGALFQIGAEVSTMGQIGMGIDAINTARLGGVSGKLYELGSGGGKSLLDIGPNVQGSALVDIIDNALTRVSTLRGRLGAVQKSIIETNISSLGVALENISEARSQIVDTDFAEETARMTRGQILSQSGISVLAIANQNPAQVLSLLG